MNHKIIFNESTSVQAAGNDEHDYMLVRSYACHLVNLFNIRGYMYLNQIYEYYGVKWDPNDDNYCYTIDKDHLAFSVLSVGEGLEITF